jgi:hypothetical protein
LEIFRLFLAVFYRDSFQINCQVKKTTNFLPQSLIGKNLCFMENIGAWGKLIGKIFLGETP